MFDVAQNQTRNYQKLNDRLNEYAQKLQLLIDDLITEAVTIAQTSATYPSFFTLDDERMEQLLDDFSLSATTLISNGEAAEWAAANIAVDTLVNGIVKDYLDYLSPTKRAAYFLVNNDALKAFQSRRIAGLSLSSRVWQLTTQFKTQLEETIATAIQRGTAARDLARQVQRYIANPIKYNVNSYDTHAATMRLARSEINMAYRTAEQTRWRQLDFVVGYRILLSHRHPKTDICDQLKGSYPKSFVWTGWHPCDLCFCIPILKTEKELWALDYDDINSTASVNEVTDVPQNFKAYIKNNYNRIANMKSQPYFILDNPEYFQP